MKNDIFKVSKFEEMMKRTILLLLAVFAITSLFSCSGENEENYFKEARKNLARREFQKAVDNFVSILDKFPSGKLAPKAALEIAKIYHARAIKKVPKNESLKIAVKYYKMCNSLSPESREGANALFMAGFIEANELKDFESARKTYQEFLKKYPENPMAKSAEIEIKNLGVEPEKIIENEIKHSHAR